MYRKSWCQHINKTEVFILFTKVKLQQGVTLYICNSDQFKTVNFSLKWKSDLNVEKSAARTVLANVLEHSNGEFRTQSALRNKLDEMYGTVLYTDTGKRGDTHIFSLNVECVNNEFVSDSNILNETIDLIQTVIFNPNKNEGVFNADIVAREKQSIIERIRSQYDNKTSYAQKRMLEILRPDSDVSSPTDGTVEAVEAITPASLLSTYESMIEEDEIDIYVIGAIDEAVITEKLQEMLRFNDRPERKKSAFKEVPTDASFKLKHVKEKQDMKQGKLHLGYRTPVTFHHPDYAKMQVTNGVFGAFAHSKLFVNVREKESLAYYASSSYASQYGLVYVMAGIDAESEEKAVNLIGAQLTAMQNGEISDLELNQTKALLRNSITSTFDSARGQIEVFDQFKALNENFEVSQLIEAWEAVTKEDVQKMAASIQLEVVYLLSGKEDVLDEASSL